MARDNQKSWDVDVGAFPSNADIKAQIKFLLGFAILAPSGHNSQPWKFLISGDQVEFLVNKERSLAKSDPAERQLAIAFGCALENLIIVADYFGFEVQIQYPTNEELRISVSFRKVNEGRNDPQHLIFAIAQRRTNRGKYENKPVPQDFLRSLEALSDQTIKVVTITNREKMNSIADIVNRAQIEIMDDPLFREELSHYIKSSFTKEKVGMPGYTLGIPWLISLFASRVIKKVNMSRKDKKKDDQLLKICTPAFFVVASAQNEKQSWIKSGQMFERIWLLAQQSGLSCAPNAAPIQNQKYSKDLQVVLGVKYFPQVLSRIGYSDYIPRHSPRVLIEDVTRE